MYDLLSQSHGEHVNEDGILVSTSIFSKLFKLWKNILRESVVLSHPLHFSCSQNYIYKYGNKMM